jgi:hypothetical protein
MSPAEIARRFKKKAFEAIDTRCSRDWMSVQLKSGGTYPVLPNPKNAPEPLRTALKRDMPETLAGRWRAFGHLPIEVTDPPRWHKDNLAGVDLADHHRAFALEYRTLPHHADIKLIWELSRWHELTRLAMAACILGEDKAARKCVHWLEHWAQHNPPYRGWNWTSALEAGMRLVQFAWIEALLQPFVGHGEVGTGLEQLRYEILPSHAWFTWRHKSFGSSANNHLLGELAGLVISTARWPELATWGTNLDELQPLWEREVLAQFAQDGGNREQALAYHLFSFEFCWHTRAALIAAGREIGPAVEQRLTHAMQFFRNVHAGREPWNYGDSDDGFVLPLFSDPIHREREWHGWMADEKSARSINYWIGNSSIPSGRTPPPLSSPAQRGNSIHSVEIYPDSGIAVAQNARIFLRLDASPLGYLATAAHAHLDALHLSIWIDEIAMIIDPGTGAYYSDTELRGLLSSHRAHNGPQPDLFERPRRLGTFLWSEHHRKPSIGHTNRGVITAEHSDSNMLMRRSLDVSNANQVAVTDSLHPDNLPSSFTVLWQFAPGVVCRNSEPGKFRLTREKVGLEIVPGPGWERVDLVTKPPPDGARVPEGTVSPHFRSVTWAPYLKLRASPGDRQHLFTTTFSVIDESS